MIISVYISDDELLEKIKATAEKDSRSVSFIITEILKKHFEGGKNGSEQKSS